ncbi:hypothetical protein [Gorillibacterium sp. CAU 1737]|uniref:hypothetical protein n=1 Tax=Gorillibacterium sp. CAU 1737 TaxID=3140362 RepID=UPI0032613B9F
MHLFGNELMKVLRKKLVFLLIPLMLIANGALFSKEQWSEHGDLIRYRSEFEQVEEAYARLPVQQAADKAMADYETQFAYLALLTAAADPSNPVWIAEADRVTKERPGLLQSFAASPYSKEPDLLRKELLFSEWLLKQYKALTDYPAFLEEIKQRAESLLTVSIFQEPSSYSYRNIKKTSEDFESLAGLELRPGLEEGIVRAATYPITDILAAASILLIGIYLFLFEKETKIIPLLRSCERGRLSLGIAKLSALFTLTALLVIAFHGTILLLGYQFYGFGDLSRPIQSMNAFQHSNLRLTVLQFLVLMSIGKLCASVVFAWIAALLFTFFHRAAHALLGLIGLVGGSFAATLLLSPSSTWNALQSLNVVAFFDCYSILAHYQNLNILGYPIARSALTASLTLWLLLTLPVLCTWKYAHGSSHSPLSRGVPPYLDKLRQRPRSYPLSVSTHELRKLMVTGKAGLIVVVAIMVAWLSIDRIPLRFNQDQAVYQRYLSQLEGMVTEEKLDFLEKERQVYADLPNEEKKLTQDQKLGMILPATYQERLGELQLLATRQKGFQQVMEQADRLEQLNRERGIEGYFVNELASSYLFERPTVQLVQALLLMGLLQVGISSLFPLDSQTGMAAILRTTLHGRRRLFAIKYAAAFGIAILLTVLVYSPAFFNLQQHFHRLDWAAPVQSIESFKTFPFDISLRVFLWLVAGLQLFGTFCLVSCSLCASLLIKRQSLTILLNMTLWGSPLLMEWMGLSSIRSISFNQTFLLYAGFSSTSILRIIGYFIMLAGMAICSLWLGWRSYNKASWGGVKIHAARTVTSS